VDRSRFDLVRWPFYPRGVDRYESWVDQQIRLAQERGEFDNLPGAGKPLDGLDDDDPDWWVRKFLEREKVDFTLALPPAVALRKEARAMPESLADLRSEAAVRERVEDYNERVLADRRRPATGPNAPMWAPFVDVEDMVRRWHELQPQPEPAPQPVPPPRRTATRGWLRRLIPGG
jgi:Domain of unknown function (DUF1992)